MSLPNDLLSIIIGKMPFTIQYDTANAVFLRGSSFQRKFALDKMFATGIKRNLRRAFFGDLTKFVRASMKTRIFNLPMDFAHDPIHKFPVWQGLYRKQCVSNYNVLLKQFVMGDDFHTEIKLRIHNVQGSDTKFTLYMTVDMVDRRAKTYIGRSFRHLVIDSANPIIPDLYALPGGRHERLVSCGPDMVEYQWDDMNSVIIDNCIDSLIPREFETLGWSGEQLRDILF